MNCIKNVCNCRFLIVLTICIIDFLIKIVRNSSRFSGIMLRRILNNLMETTLQNPPELSVYQSPFTKLETQQFGWLSSTAPCFPVNARNIKILSQPQEFYQVLEDGCKLAEKRIILTSLYIGGGTLEKKLVETILNNANYSNLKIRVLLDYTRGSRLQDQNNSRLLLQPLIAKGENCKVSLYHTPVLRGLIRKIAPSRWNELFGLQHMKLYIFDDTLVISGANLSSDYFTNRQDRYFVINNKNLCDFYVGLVKKVQKFSLTMDQHNEIRLEEDWKQLPYEGRKEDFVKKAGDLVENFIIDVKNERNCHREEGYDTWIFPLIQMGQLGISQDSNVTTRILSEAPPESKLCIASGYFNLTDQYMKTLIEKTSATCKILMAHPETNGFLNAKGAAGGIPYAYSLIAKKFYEKLQVFNQQHRISLFEYLRDKWTYHAKGLWYYPSGKNKPCLTLIGSPNFGERSVGKDLETQLAIVTENEELQEELHKECVRLFSLGVPAEVNREVPKWVHAFVLLFRKYF